MKSYFPAQILLSADFREELEKLGDFASLQKKSLGQTRLICIGFPLKVLHGSWTKTRLGI